MLRADSSLSLMGGKEGTTSTGTPLPHQSSRRRRAHTHPHTLTHTLTDPHTGHTLAVVASQRPRALVGASAAWREGGRGDDGHPFFSAASPPVVSTRHHPLGGHVKTVRVRRSPSTRARPRARRRCRPRRRRARAAADARGACSSGASRCPRSASRTCHHHHPHHHHGARHRHPSSPRIAPCRIRAACLTPVGASRTGGVAARRAAAAGTPRHYITVRYVTQRGIPCRTGGAAARRAAAAGTPRPPRTVLRAARAPPRPTPRPRGDDAMMRAEQKPRWRHRFLS